MSRGHLVAVDDTRRDDEHGDGADGAARGRADEMAARSQNALDEAQLDGVFLEQKGPDTAIEHWARLDRQLQRLRGLVYVRQVRVGRGVSRSMVPPIGAVPNRVHGACSSVSVR